MPRYFFDVTDNGKVVVDTFGHDLADDEAAREDALVVLGQRARDAMPDGDHRIFVIDVLGEDRRQILTASLSVMVTYPNARRLRPK